MSVAAPARSVPVAIIPVTAFVDWNSQIHAANPGPASPLDVAQRTLEYVGRVIGRALVSISTGLRFDVTLRVYHGWRKGFEVSDNRKALIGAVAGADFLALSRKVTVSIRPDVEYGDLLLSATWDRLHPSHGCHLPNTLRWSNEPTPMLEEKMVDTAIASDLIDVAHRERDTWLLVLGDDDDLVPPVFVAEAVRQGTGTHVLLIRTRPDTVFLKLDGIRFKP